MGTMGDGTDMKRAMEWTRRMNETDPKDDGTDEGRRAMEWVRRATGATGDGCDGQWNGCDGGTGVTGDDGTGATGDG
jgi:hypothetical protein